LSSHHVFTTTPLPRERDIQGRESGGRESGGRARKEGERDERETENYRNTTLSTSLLLMNITYTHTKRDLC
jgi:hypothetical protein